MQRTKGINMQPKNVHYLQQSVNALKCLSVSIPISIESDAITAEQVGDLLSIFARQLEATIKSVAESQPINQGGRG
jgi:hypothetical protein